MLAQLLAEILINFGINTAGEPFRERSNAHPLIAGLGVIALGGLAGLISILAWPMPVVRPNMVPGASLILSPLITGLVMDRYGDWQKNRTGWRSFAATFWGGALFAFSMALVRFIWVTV